MSNFLPVDAVGRGSETQLQLGEKLSYLIWRFKGLVFWSFLYETVGHKFVFQIFQVS